MDSLRRNRKEEVEAITKAISDGQSTFEMYKSLKKDSVILGLSERDFLNHNEG